MAAICPPPVKRAWIEVLGADAIWEIYGGTERIGSTIIGGAEWLAHPGSVGRPRPGIEARVLDEDGAELPSGGVGEIYFRRAGGRSWGPTNRTSPTACPAYRATFAWWGTASSPCPTAAAGRRRSRWPSES
jgi:acyl-CoA synthetase (AMP-forming)/AMP-acid ligase II